MGQIAINACPCLEPQTSYTEVESPSKPLVIQNSVDTQNSDSSDPHFSSFPDERDPSNLGFDLSLPVFRGMLVQQKFSTKSSYDTRFAWIKLDARTLCLSEHQTTTRRHKAARIADMTGLIAGPPERFKAPADAALCNWDTFLSIQFHRGGGIDLRFESKAERNLWFDVLERLINQQRALDEDAPAINHNPSGISDNTSSSAAARNLEANSNAHLPRQ